MRSLVTKVLRPSLVAQRTLATTQQLDPVQEALMAEECVLVNNKDQVTFHQTVEIMHWKTIGEIFQ